jgi:hypothetical protein
MIEAKQPEEVNAVFATICDLCIELGYQSIKDLPGCLEHQVDKQWWFAINPHDKSIASSHSVTVFPFSIYIEFNSWPFGIVNCRGGMCGHGVIANENTLIEALKAAIVIAKAGGK